MNHQRVMVILLEISSTIYNLCPKTLAPKTKLDLLITIMSQITMILPRIITSRNIKNTRVAINMIIRVLVPIKMLIIIRLHLKMITILIQINSIKLKLLAVKATTMKPTIIMQIVDSMLQHTNTMLIKIINNIVEMI